MGEYAELAQRGRRMLAALDRDLRYQFDGDLARELVAALEALQREYRQLSNLHEIATQRTVELAAAIEKAPHGKYCKPWRDDGDAAKCQCWKASVDTSTVLSARDAEKWDEGDRARLHAVLSDRVRELSEENAELRARLSGVDVHDIELLRRERDEARAKVEKLQAVALVLDKAEAQQPRDIDGMLYTIPWAEDIVRDVRRVDTDAVLRERDAEKWEEGVRQAREAVVTAEGVTFHKWLPEGEDYPSVVIHGEDAAKAVVLAAIAAGVNPYRITEGSNDQ